MTIPKYHEMYEPFLNCLKDGLTHNVKEVKQYVADTMKISIDDRKVLLPSGKQVMYDNRIGWTRTYLKKAGLIESPTRGVFKITVEGKKLLEEKHEIINDNLLMKFESFREFKEPSIVTDVQPVKPNDTDKTPQDLLDEAYEIINKSLSDDLLSEVMKQTPDFFEVMVVKLLEKMGYGGTVEDSGIVVGRSGDEGIDGIIREDKLGFNLIYIQAKRWNTDQTIGRPEIQKFYGALAGQGSTKGLFITTAKFSREAIDYAKKQHIILVDGKMLTSLMIEYNLGVSAESVYEIKKIDSDFFADDN